MSDGHPQSPCTGKVSDPEHLFASEASATLPASPAARSAARPAARSSGTGGGEMADGEEGPVVQLDLSHVNGLSAVPPIAGTSAPPPSLWQLEAEAYHRAGVHDREIALNLPPASEARAALLRSADARLGLARMRGVYAA